VLIHTHHAALENRVVALDRVGGHVAAHVFVKFVVDGLMVGVVLAETTIPNRVIRMQCACAFAPDVGPNDRD
jgi:hypothetical protein